MGPNVNRQDVQNMINVCQNRLLERTASKQDVQMVNDTIKALLNIHQQNQQILRQAEYQRSQLTRRTMAIEARIAQFEQDIRSIKDVLNRIAAQPQQIVLTTPEASGESEGRAPQYIYRPV